jgi:hypothetical protein
MIVQFYVVREGKLIRRGSIPAEWVEFQAIEPGEEAFVGEPPQHLLTPPQVQ